MKSVALSMTSLALLLAASAPALAQESICPDCELLAAREQAIGSTPLKLQDELKNPVDQVVSHLGSPLSFDFTQWMAPPSLVVNWSVGQPLPFSFQIPWELPKTDFSPAFVTPFYSSQTGVNWSLFPIPGATPVAQPENEEVRLRLT